MTPAQRIRKAALGPVPLYRHIAAWLPRVPDWDAFDIAHANLGDDWIHWLMVDDDVRRMFLLFVAEALENE